MPNKVHHHTGFECHIIQNGYQIYEMNGVRYRIEQGECLLIGPRLPHRSVAFDHQTEKYAFTFEREWPVESVCCHGKTPARVVDNIRFILAESGHKKEISPALIENTVLESLVLLLRMTGIKENPPVDPSSPHSILDLAKRYIEDNIEQNPHVTDVATYCHLSAKQLTRLFSQCEGIPPAEYIQQQRIRTIEQLLDDPSLSLKTISERLNFSSEYYFNAFFRKNNGMPPGEYRKMIGQ